jgi:hypothetical protein
MNYVKSYSSSWTGGGWTHRSIIIGNFEIDIKTGSSTVWGRFGGGWNWCFGFEIGGSTVMINLLIFSIKFGSISNERKAKLLDKA